MEQFACWPFLYANFFVPSFVAILNFMTLKRAWNVQGYTANICMYRYSRTKDYVEMTQFAICNASAGCVARI